MNLPKVDIEPYIAASGNDFVKYAKSVANAITADMNTIVKTADPEATEADVVNLCVVRAKEWVTEFEKMPGVKTGDFAALLKRMWKVYEDDQPLSIAMRNL